MSDVIQNVGDAERNTDAVAAIACAQIEARIVEVEKEREQFVTQANQQIAGYNAALGELRRLLAPVQRAST